ncbi:MAG TPA: hypothetical protein VFN13_03475 [Rudaea sp.]|nr:hypothetical protein [Rudaea sp.]
MLVAVGTGTLNANQAGDANFAPAAPVSISFPVQAARAATPTMSDRMSVLPGLLLGVAGLGWQRRRKAHR